MAKIGAYEAKTHLPRLLERVEHGETFTITRHGVAIAELRPVHGSSRLSVEDAIAGLRMFRQEHPLGGTTIRELIEDGRRW
jgi:antitoxin (DNA-binding transcriptional repressor) of toxin-antitoxin stability system